MIAAEGANTAMESSAIFAFWIAWPRTGKLSTPSKRAARRTSRRRLGPAHSLPGRVRLRCRVGAVKVVRQQRIQEQGRPEEDAVDSGLHQKPADPQVPQAPAQHAGCNSTHRQPTHAHPAKPSCQERKLQRNKPCRRSHALQNFPEAAVLERACLSARSCRSWSQVRSCGFKTRSEAGRRGRKKYTATPNMMVSRPSIRNSQVQPARPPTPSIIKNAAARGAPTTCRTGHSYILQTWLLKAKHSICLK